MKEVRPLHRTSQRVQLHGAVDNTLTLTQFRLSMKYVRRPHFHPLIDSKVAFIRFALTDTNPLPRTRYLVGISLAPSALA